MTPSIQSFPCTPNTVNFTVTATAANANAYTWSVSGGTLVSTSGNTATFSRTGCNQAVGVSCNATRSECNNFIGTNGNRSISTSGAGSLPTSITGPVALCDDAPNNSSVYSVPAGANSCTTYNWYFSPTTTAISISGATTATPTLTVNSNPAEGYKYLKCGVNTCGASTTLSKTITVCKAVTTPTYISATQQGSSCYYKFTATGGCASSWQWQVNGGSIQNTPTNIITDAYEPGYYIVKVRNVNACGTSAWRTETFNLPNINHNPPCMMKTDPTNDASNDQVVDFSSVEFDIYPNPSNGHSEIILQCGKELQGGVFEIYDLTGKKVLIGTIDDTRSVIQTKGLNAGLYFCGIKNGSVHTMKKFIISF